MSKTTVTMFTNSVNTNSNNIAAKEAPGHKKQENVFISSFIGAGSGGVSYVNSKTRSTNDQQGAIVNTGVISDIAIDGAGLLVISDGPTGNIKYTRRGDFRQDDLGYWKNGADQYLKAWRLDGNGNLPQNSALLGSLEAVNFADTQGLPVKTSIISIAMNLNSEKTALRGPGPEDGFIIQRTGDNKTTKPKDILVPDQVGTQSLRLGDAFTFLSSEGQAAKTVTYGGITIGNKATNASPVFGATSANTTFAFNAVAGPGLLVDGQQFRIAVQGSGAYTFTAVSGQPSGNTFNSIQSLANAINRISSLNARVVEDRLYIAPKDANKSLTYQNVGGNTNIVETLGLSNLASAAANVNRFNSLTTLRDAVNSNQTNDSLLATIEPGNNIKITSLLSTSSLTISSNQVDGNKISRAVINPDNNAVSGAEVFITAPNNGLEAGDLVRIANMGANTPDGTYVVGKRNDNGFTINIVDVPANYNQPQTNIAVPQNATWKIASGEKFDQINATITQADAAGDIQITSNGHGYANNDVIYTEGGVFELNIDNIGGGGQANKTITLPAGYYTVTNSLVNTFTLTPTGVAAAGGGGGNNSLNFRKVGVTGGANPFNTTVFSTGANGTTEVNYHAGRNNHGYVVGSTIRFDGLASVNNVITPLNGITLNPNFDYIVTAVNNGMITFDVVDDPNANASTGVANIDLAAQPTAKFNQHSRLFEYFGLNPEKDAANAANLDPNFVATYNPLDIDKNLTGGNFPSSEIFTHPLTVYDSMGATSTLLLHFAKLENNKWAVELAVQPDENGVFKIDGLAASNGLIKFGTISFNQDGTLNVGNIEGFNEAVEINWNNGSEPSSIVIDFPNELSDIKTGKITQVQGPSNVGIVQSNGQSAGSLLSLQIDQDGFIVGTFNSGETRKLYKIPVAIFANVNGLVPGTNGTFEVSRESGALLLKSAGVGGAGRTIGGVLEASNADTTEELLRVQELSNTIRANARVAASEFKNIATILNELSN